MRKTMLGWIEAADARLVCERPTVVSLTRYPRSLALYAVPAAALFASLRLVFAF